jgi:hypothetical protein
VKEFVSVVLTFLVTLFVKVGSKHIVGFEAADERKMGKLFSPGSYH